MFVLLLLSAEWAARSYERHRSRPPDYFPQIYYPHRNLRYGLVPNLDYYGWFKINSLGFRGAEVTAKKKAGVSRIVCLGASTTFDIGTVGKSRPWPEIMEGELRKKIGKDSIEVLNLGIPGATSLDSLIDLQTRVLSLDPDLVVVYQGHNDFIYSFGGTAQRDSTLYPLETPPRSAFVRWLTYHSVLYAKTSNRVGLKLSEVWRTVTFRSREQAAPRDPTAGIEQGLTEFRSNLASIASIAKSRNLPVILPEIVLPYQESGTENCNVCAGLSGLFNDLEPARVRAVFERYTQVSMDLATKGGGVYYIPTGDFVPHEDRYYHDPIHFGPEGSRRMGERMAEAVLPILRAISAERAVGQAE